MTARDKIQLNELRDVRSAQHLLKLVYGDDIEQISLPIKPEDIIKKISGVTYENEYSFDDWDNSGFIRVHRKENNDIKNISIWVNPAEASVRQRFTLAHEIGHLIHDILPNIDNENIDECFEDKLHRNGESNFKETRANKFSAQLLMPAPLVKREISNLVKQLKREKKKVTVSEVISKLSAVFNVSEDATRIRLKTLKYIKQ